MSYDIIKVGLRYKKRSMYMIYCCEEPRTQIRDRRQTSTGRDLRSFMPRCRNRALHPPSAVALALDRVRRIRRVCNVAFIVKVEINFFFCFFSRTEWQGEIAYVLDLFIFIGGKSFENTLEVVPVKYANRRE